MFKRFFQNTNSESGIIKYDSGFTLIEIIVSLAIFVLVAVVALGAFLKVLDANKKSQTLKTAINNVNFALESMTREMRVGSSYTCLPGFDSNSPTTINLSRNGAQCGLNGSSGMNRSFTVNNPMNDAIAFFSSKPLPLTSPSVGYCKHNAVYVYAFNGTSIKKAEQVTCETGDLPTSASVTSFNLTDFIEVISPDTIIDQHDIKIDNALDLNVGPQPRAFIHLKGHSGVREKDKTYFDVQTTISQRNPF